jgi:hypothetical protein
MNAVRFAWFPVRASFLVAFALAWNVLFRMDRLMLPQRPFPGPLGLVALVLTAVLCFAAPHTPWLANAIMRPSYNVQQLRRLLVAIGILCIVLAGISVKYLYDALFVSPITWKS